MGSAAVSPNQLRNIMEDTALHNRISPRPSHSSIVVHSLQTSAGNQQRLPRERDGVRFYRYASIYISCIKVVIGYIDVKPITVPRGVFEKYAVFDIVGRFENAENQIRLPL